MRAHIKHTLLFHPHIVISDSYAIKNYNFRSLLRTDPQLQQIVIQQMVMLACRVENEVQQTLNAVRDRTPSGEGPPEFTDEEYRSDAELDLLETYAQKMPYCINEVANHYTRSTRDIFAGRQALEALGGDEAVLTTLNEVIDEISDAGAIPLRLAQFHYGTGDVARRFSARTGTDWAQWEEAVTKLARASYVTALPTLLKTDAVYAKTHAEAFEISWNRPASVREEEAVRYQSNLGLHSFVQGISLLTVDDVVWLCDTSEGRAYENVVAERETDRQLIKDVIFAYQRRIEDRILDSHRGLSIASSDGSEWALTLGYGEKVMQGFFRAFLTAAFGPLLGGVLGIMTRSPLEKVAHEIGGVRAAKEARNRAKVRADNERQELREELISEWIGGERVNAELLVADEQLEAVYEGVSGTS